MLVKTVNEGFPDANNKVDSAVKAFWGTKDRLSTQGCLVLMDNRLVIPDNLRTPVLRILHLAHQGCTGMVARASRSMYWPGWEKDITNFRLGCITCMHPANGKSL